MSDQKFDRRRLLGLLGAGVGAAALGACGRGGEAGPPSPTGGATATSTTAIPAGPGGAVTAAMFAGAATCAATVEQTEGPYHLDIDQIRADVREDRPGTPLRIAARVVDADGCTPIPDAVFEIWHCDAEGLYSGFEAASRGEGGARDAERYLRGAQVTNAEGIAVITTVYPGWYEGRTVHVHAKVALSNTDLLTTQVYFDDAVTDVVFEAEPYRQRPNRRTRNADDRIYRESTTLTVSRDADGAGYLGLITIGVQA